MTEPGSSGDKGEDQPNPYAPPSFEKNQPPPPPYGQQPPPYGQQPPPYGQQPPPYGYPPGGYGAPAIAKPPNYLVWAIVNLLICWPLAIVAIVQATKVNSKWAAGDYPGAERASKQAKQFALIGTVLGLCALAILVSQGEF